MSFLNKTLIKTILALCFCSAALFACGSSSSGDGSSSESDEATLAEVSATLPKTGTINLASEEGTNDSSNSASSPSATSSSSSISFSMRRFLWKPSSERDGNLVVLVDPVGVRVEVFGSISETLTDFGPSNDRGTTARGSFPGCSYGSNIQLQFYSRRGQRLGFVNGRSTVTIPNGCNREEFNL